MRNLLFCVALVACAAVACGGGQFTTKSDDTGEEAGALDDAGPSHDASLDDGGEKGTDSGELVDSAGGDSALQDAPSPRDSAPVEDSGKAEDSGSADDAGSVRDTGPGEAGECTGAGQCDSAHPCPTGDTCCASILANRQCGSCSASRICPG
jgi:hypothetical protein